MHFKSSVSLIRLVLLQIGVVSGSSVRNKARGSFDLLLLGCGPWVIRKRCWPFLASVLPDSLPRNNRSGSNPRILYLIVIWYLRWYPLDRCVQGDGREQGERWCQPRWASKSGGCLFSHKADTPCNSHLVLRGWHVGTPHSDTDLGHALEVIGLSRWTPRTISPLWLHKWAFLY